MTRKKHSSEETPADAPPPAGEATGAPAAAADAPIDADAGLQQEAADVSAEIDALKDRLLRLHADFDNFRKRTARERTDLFVRANADLIGELLPVLDHFEIGLRAAVEHGADASVRDGFQLVYDQMRGALAKFGLEPIDAEGQVFDAHAHEAVAQVPSADVPAGSVVQQVRRGYRLGGQLLRAAQVLVSGGPPAAAEGEPPAAAPEKT